jgi:hypothetical protein
MLLPPRMTNLYEMPSWFNGCSPFHFKIFENVVAGIINLNPFVFITGKIKLKNNNFIGWKHIKVNSIYKNLLDY